MSRPCEQGPRATLFLGSGRLIGVLIIHRLRLLIGRRRFGGNLRQRVELAEHVVIFEYAQILDRFEILLFGGGSGRFAIAGGARQVAG